MSTLISGVRQHWYIKSTSKFISEKFQTLYQ